MAKNAYDFKELSKTISHALRHEPWLYELELDEEGWVTLEALIGALQQERPEWGSLQETEIHQMIKSSDKRRHEIEQNRIRALYGHSLPQKLKRIPATPPAELYHGTSPETAKLIKSVGILPMKRQYVHLSVDKGTAFQVGRRKSISPVILTVNAGLASKAGIPFYQGNEMVWLADSISPEFVEEAFSAY